MVTGIMLTLLLASVLTAAFKLTPVKAKVVMIGPIEIYAEKLEMWNLTMHGPRTYSGLDVTNITMDLAVFSNMSLTRCIDGKNLTTNAPNATATKLILYTTYIGWAGTEIYGNTTVEIPSPGQPPVPYFAILNVLMKAVYLQAESFSIFSVHNIDSGKDYATIQEAIDANETLDGHTILVDAGTYYEHVTVHKALALIGEETRTTIIDGNGTGRVVSAKAPSVEIRGFTIQNGGQGLADCGIFIGNCTGNTIRNNIIRKNYNGLELLQSKSSNIVGNTIIDNSYAGVYIHQLGNNTVCGNTIVYNVVGAWIASSTVPNTFHHNNFIDNTHQASDFGIGTIWDDGYPSGGNYWSDYSDVDLYCGPNQDIWGSDGVWDHEYVIDANNRDNYPLVKPYVSGNLTISIYTDKYTYHAGDTMHLGLNFTNPDSVKYLCFAIWCKLPGGSIYPYIHQHSVILPIGLRYNNPSFKSITLPTLPTGNYTWHAAFLDRATHTIITEDTAEWQFS